MFMIKHCKVSNHAVVLCRAQRWRPRWESWATTSWWRRSSSTNTRQTAAEWAKVRAHIWSGSVWCHTGLINYVRHESALYSSVQTSFPRLIFPSLHHKHQLETSKTWKPGGSRSLVRGKEGGGGGGAWGRWGGAWGRRDAWGWGEAGSGGKCRVSGKRGGGGDLVLYFVWGWLWSGGGLIHEEN